MVIDDPGIFRFPEILGLEIGVTRMNIRGAWSWRMGAFPQGEEPLRSARVWPLWAVVSYSAGVSLSVRRETEEF